MGLEEFCKEIDFKIPREALDYATANRCKLNKKNERLIASDGFYSCDYAREVLRSRFKLGEPAIARSSHCSYLYAATVLRSRFKLGERSIIDGSDYSGFENTELYCYIQRIIGKTIPIDFLRKCSPKALIEILRMEHVVNDVTNKKDIAKVLYEKYREAEK